MFERALAARGVDAVVLTAGFGTGEHPATRNTLVVADRRGLALDKHRSRHFAAELDGVDLVLTMERLHVRDLVVADPNLWPRSFTLKGAVRCAETIGPRGEDEPLSAWLQRLHSGRRSQDLLGTSSDDEVADPAGGPLVEHEETADELEDLVQRFVDLAWPAATAIAWSNGA